MIKDDTGVPDGVHMLEGSVSDEISCCDGELFEGNPEQLAFSWAQFQFPKLGPPVQPIQILLQEACISCAVNFPLNFDVCQHEARILDLVRKVVNKHGEQQWGWQSALWRPRSDASPTGRVSIDYSSLLPIMQI